MRRIPRRAFLGLIAGAAVGAGFGGWELTRGSGTAKEPFALRVVRRVLGDPNAAARIGAVYLDEHPHAAAGRPGFKFEPLDPAHYPGGEPALTRLFSLDLAAIVRNKARGNARDDELTLVDGWLLPQTICDLCAVAKRQLE